MCKGRRDSGDYSQDLQLVDVVIELFAVDAVDNSSTRSSDVALAALGHIAHDLQLSRGAFLEVAAVKPDLELACMLLCLLEWIGT